MLEIVLNTRDVPLTEWLQSYVEKKIGKMDRYLPHLTEAQVELRHEPVKNANHRYVAQVTLRGPGTTIRAQERASDMTAAIDAVVDVLYRQIVRYKGKRFARIRQRQAMAQAAEAELPPLSPEALAELEAEDQVPARIVRVKRFSLQPMDEQEAIQQMELLGHTFFVFYNVNNGRVNVVYRRLDGNYGLLDPEIA
jgi:putative sigma-54 modulation protein